ncbi:MAG: hypothetical protein ABL883_12190 [Terricaulis sp.]
MNAPPLIDTPPRAAPLELWRAAAAFLNLLHALFGDPSAVATRGALTSMTYKTIASWLRAGEAMMRRLLLIEAAAFPKPETRALRPSSRQRARKLMSFEAAHPEGWRVSFRCFASAPRRPPMLRTGRIARQDRNSNSPKVRSAWPLAERYEALLRVFNDPSACARRLSRRLHAAPHRAASLLRAPPEAESRVELFAGLTAAATTLAARFNSS